MAYSLAVERLLAIEVPERAAAIRVLMTELNRISSHLVALATNGMDIGALSMMLYGFRERESILAFFEKTTGLRMNHNYIRPGGVAADLPPGWKDDVSAILADLPGRLDQYDDLLKENPIWLARTRGIGVISQQEAIAFSITGPILRATGVDWDLRKVFPYSGIEQYEFDVITGENGDVYDRYLVRMNEMRESLKICRQVLEKLPGGPVNVDADSKVILPPLSEVFGSIEGLFHHFMVTMESRGFTPPVGEAYVPTESPNGELGYFIVSNGGREPYRIRTRPPSLLNYSAVPKMMENMTVSDAVAILGSLNIIAGELDR